MFCAHGAGEHMIWYARCNKPTTLERYLRTTTGFAHDEIVSKYPAFSLYCGGDSRQSWIWYRV